MSDGQIETGYREIVFHDDDGTPAPFVIELLHAVFKKQLADAYRFVGQIAEDGNASCGSYPGDVAA
jgi:ATP-dependent Clp protease adapter protein ClpS